MMRKMTIPAIALLLSVATYQTAGFPQQKSFNDIVQEMKATIEPAEAKPGQTVTWKLTVKLIPGWHTYPVKQVDKNAEDSVTKFDFAELKKAGLTATGAIKDPPKFKKKAEPELKIKELRYYEGEVVWTQQLKLAAGVKPGTHAAKVKVTMQVCDDKGCLPPETVETEAAFTVK